MASSSTTLQVEALSTVHANYADDEKRGLKRRLATCEKELTSEHDFPRYKEACTAVAMEDIKIHCETSIGLLDSMHDRLVDGFRSSNGMSLSQAEVWEMMRSIIEVSNRLTDIHEDAELREEPSSDEQ